MFPVVRLTEIFRQEETSGIVYASHDIFQGRMPDLEAYEKDFLFVPMSSDNNVLQGIKGLVRKFFTRGVEFQVLSPRHLGTIGVTNLNKHLREMINPSQSGLEEIKIGDDVLRQGDRVMVVKNNYEKGVFNGDLGKINQVIRAKRKVIVKIYGKTDKLIEFNFGEVQRHLRLSYACTVHKFQGLEIDTIIMPVVDSFGPQLQRNLLYTAVTRAKNKVILLGSKKALQKSILNDKESLRNTLFARRLVNGY
jgi:exodeoxyribonuclease V alpha subunit